MWKIKEISKVNGEIGELELHRMDETGNPTRERLILPVTLDPDANRSDIPLTMDDSLLAFLIRGFMGTLDLDEKPDQPLFDIKTFSHEISPEPIRKAKICGHVNL